MLAMTRQDPNEAYDEADEQLKRFSNIKFIQGDCLKTDSYPMEEIASCDAVIHTVGTLIEGINYKSILKDGISGLPTDGITGTINKIKDPKVPYEESYEAINRDACKLLAEKFNSLCSEND